MSNNFDDPKWYPSGHADFKDINRQLDQHFRRKRGSDLAKELAYYRTRLLDPEVRNDPMQRTAVEGIIKLYRKMLEAERRG